MRTTIEIDHDLLLELKRQAVDRGLSVSDLVNRMLRDALRQQTEDGAGPFRMIVHGAAQGTIHHEPSDFHAVVVEDDTAGLRIC